MLEGTRRVGRLEVKAVTVVRRKVASLRPMSLGLVLDVAIKTATCYRLARPPFRRKVVGVTPTRLLRRLEWRRLPTLLASS